MKQNHRTAFGRPISAVVTKPQAVQDGSGLCDKWALLTALTQAAGHYGLNHRNLAVLRALLSFHPDRLIAPVPRSCIVFPANATLSTRLSGMPESTLRRHLARLVEAGIVSRHDSATRKRFPRGRAGEGRTAFGFDLSPLARLAPVLVEQARAAEQEHRELQARRAELAALRQQVIDLCGPSTATDDAFKTLRRKPMAEALTCAIAALKEVLETLEMSACDNQNERHIHTEFKILSVEQTGDPIGETDDTPSFGAVVAQCREYRSYFPEPACGWQDLSRSAHALAPMIGIDRAVYAQAQAAMGPKRAITAVLCILENLARIANPGGYLRRLMQSHMAGQLDMHRLLEHASGGELSAGNVKIGL